jgi:hypothetical protein
VKARDINGVTGIPVTHKGRDYLVERRDGVTRTIVYAKVQRAKGMTKLGYPLGWYWRPIADAGPTFFNVLRELKKLEDKEN